MNRRTGDGELKMVDETQHGHAISVTFKGKLRANQAEAALHQHRHPCWLSIDKGEETEARTAVGHPCGATARECGYGEICRRRFRLHGASFVAPFVSSLAEARQSVIICCPKMKSVQQHPIATRLIDLSHNGIKVTVFTRGQNEETARLLCHGIQITVMEQLSLQCAVIDSRNVWYGSINILGYHSAEDNIMFIRSAEVATSLTEAMMRQNLTIHKSRLMPYDR